MDIILSILPVIVIVVTLYYISRTVTNNAPTVKKFKDLESRVEKLENANANAEEKEKDKDKEMKQNG